MARPLAACITFLLLLTRPALSDDAATSYRGKTVRLIISTTTGGGYDTYARAVARHLSNHLPGNPNILPQNMPGAGGIVATNYLYNSAERDGSTIALIQNTVPFEPLYGDVAARYDATKFNWLGSPNSEVAVFPIWSTVPVNSIADLKTHEVRMAAEGVNSTSAFYGRMINELLHTKMTLIEGYPGEAEAFLAMENREIDGDPTVFWSTLKTIRPQWIKNHNVKILMQYAGEPSSQLKGVPFGPDLAGNNEDRQLFLLAATPNTVGRPFLAPPGTPPDRVATLRKAFKETFRDPDFIKDLKNVNLEEDSPKTGAELAAIIGRMYSSPPKLIDRLRKIYNFGR